MEYIISLSTQTKGFLFSLGFGVILGVFYDALRIIRLTLTEKKAFIPVFDIIFTLTAAVASFLFFLTVTDGEIRLYILFGELLGFTVYYLAFGIIAVRFCEKAALKIKSIIIKIFAFIFSPFAKLCRLLRKTLKKVCKNTKILLQKDKALLYNLTDKMRKYRVKFPFGKGGAENERKSKEKDS